MGSENSQSPQAAEPATSANVLDGTTTSSESLQPYLDVVTAHVEELARSSCVPIDALPRPGTTGYPPTSRDVYNAHVSAFAKRFEERQKIWGPVFEEIARALDTATAGVSTLNQTLSSTPPETTASEQPSTAPTTPATAA